MAVLLSTTLSTTLSGADSSAFRSDFAEALTASEGEPRLLLMSAEWCGWCHKLKGEVDDNPTVAEVVRKANGIVVDADEHPELMTAYGIGGLPALVFINPKGDVVDVHTGYLKPTDLKLMVEAFLANPNREGFTPAGLDPGRRFKDLESEGGEQALLMALGSGSAHERVWLQNELSQRGHLEPRLWGLLTHQSLATRIDAAGILSRRHETHQYDPFADPEERSLQAVAWRQAVLSVQRENEGILP